MQASDECEVFFRCEIIDEKTIVDVCTGEAFPLFRTVHRQIAESDVAAVGFQQVEHQPEEGGFPCTVVAHKAEHFALWDGEVFYVDGGLFAKLFAEIPYFNHRSLFNYSIIQSIKHFHSVLLLPAFSEAFEILVLPLQETPADLVEPPGGGEGEGESGGKEQQVGQRGAPQGFQGGVKQ